VIKSSLFAVALRDHPPTLTPDGLTRPPHLRSWRDGWLHLKLLMTFAPYWLFYYPGLVLFGVGGIGFAALMFGPVQIGSVSFDIATLILASALVLTGFQMVCFYALSRVFAVRFNLLPTSARFERLRSKITVDNACVVGSLLLLTALIATLSGVFSWGATGFGDLDPSRIVRPAALAVVCASLGVQVITTGFLSAMLQQKIRPSDDPRHLQD
jgi:hypothetical protein